MPTLNADSKPTDLNESASPFGQDQNMPTKDAKTPGTETPQSESPSGTGTSSNFPFRMTLNYGISDTGFRTGLSSPTVTMAPSPALGLDLPIQVEEEVCEAETSEETEQAEGDRVGGLPVAPEDEYEFSGQKAEPESSETIEETPQGVTSEQREFSESEQPAAEDPECQEVIPRADHRAATKRAHRPTLTEVQSAISAASSNNNETENRAPAEQADEMDQQGAGAFNVEAFKNLLMDRIAATLPTNEKEAYKFSNDNRINQVRDAAARQAEQEKENTAGSIESSTQQQPDELVEPDPGPKPTTIEAELAMMSNPRPSSEVSDPLQLNMPQVELQTQEADITNGAACQF